MWQKIFTSTRKRKLQSQACKNFDGHYSFAEPNGLGPLANEKGQIAIFIALIFQILFIFFAMLINIGLIVHDKINLQNSVDLAAYYGAERQAELLNEISHINYQIRQEYKLLAWRQRILGSYTFGTNSRLPAAPPDSLADTNMPAVCVDHAGWKEVFVVDPPNPVDNCKAPNTSMPGVPTFSVIASFLGINSYLQSFYGRVSDSVRTGCQAVGPLNWFTASIWLYEYKQAVLGRSNMIRAIAENLSKPGSQFLDLKSGPVIMGVKKTFLRNLTEANRISISSRSNDVIDNPADFTFINSLSSDVPGGCSSINNGNPNWLHENLIAPKITYVNSSVGSNSACSTFVQLVEQPPTGPGMAGYNPALVSALLQYDSGEPPPGIHTTGYSSLGFEKNPWCLAYVGVKAKTRPRKPFAPFGNPVSLQARGFASPFGGRIGPWSKSTWAPGAPSSSGNSVDRLAVPRIEDGNPVGPLIPASPSIPNYSRYPGDTLGLRSMLAHYLFGVSYLSSVLPKPSPFIPLLFQLSSYNHLFDPNNKDSLSQGGGTIEAPTQALRALENAAVAPDLFDITYYSIDADFFGNYFNSATQQYKDLGAAIQFDNWNVKEQMITAKNKLINTHTPGVNWLIPNLDYLLTGWTQGRTGEYTTTPAQFAKCQIHPNYQDNWPPVPGYCVVGGRTGYSVRLIGRKYLKSSKLELGGPGIKGKLTNAPPASW